MSSGTYAAQTKVPPERSRGEIERVLQRHGATTFAYVYEDDRAMIGFKIHGKTVRMVMPLPERAEFRFNSAGRARTDTQWETAYEQAIRQRWRALLLIIKGKLESISTGIVTFDEEFAWWFVLPDGSTVGERVLPHMAEVLSSGEVPSLVPGLRALPPGDE